MGKIRHLRLCRPGEREAGIGREELAVLVGEERGPEETATGQVVVARRQEKGCWRKKKTR